MDQGKRQRLIRRISNGKFYGTFIFQNEEYPIIFEHPTLDILGQADALYEKIYDDGLIRGIITIEESYKLLQDSGLWSKKLENELKLLKIDLKNLKEILPNLQFKKQEQKATIKAIDKNKNRIEELENIKNQFWPSTLEYLSTKSQRKFIVSKCTKIDNIDFLSSSFGENSIFLDNLVVYLYSDNSISEKVIRELSRTDPWRLYWIVSKGTGTPLFNRSSSEMTEYQYSLLFWTKIYDFAYESSNRPSEDIIQDDEKFDVWYENECNRIDKETKSKQFENNNPGKGYSGQEMYIPADAEGAKEVYALNNADAMRRINQRNLALKKKDKIEEQDLPDIKSDLKNELMNTRK